MRRVTGENPLRQDQSGFTLPEVMIVVVVLGIVLAVASGSWLGTIEGRRVDSAANQLVSDLRLAHNTATNRLTTWRVQLYPGGGYSVGPAGGSLSARWLPEETGLTPADAAVVAIEFGADGGARPVDAAGNTVAGSGEITVAAADGSPSLAVRVNAVTSRVEIVG